jgi:3'(2'), 5'-bisphosphate nucleotidase
LTHTFDSYSSESAFALSAVRAAAQLGMRVQAAMITPELIKEDRSPVTVADFACQALVGRRLEMAFPDDPLVAEESSQALRGAAGEDVRQAVVQHLADTLGDTNSHAVEAWIDRGQGSPAVRFWTLDPVDGTAGFLRHEHWVVALALIEDGRVQVAALGCPRLDLEDGESAGPSSGSVAVAVRGEGAWGGALDAGELRRLRVSDCADPAQARMLASVEAGHTNLDQLRQLQAELGLSRPPVRMDSQAKYAALASGQGDLIFRLLSPSKPDYREKIWDQAAGSLIVEEAGGQVSDLRGDSLDFSAGRMLDRNLGVLVSNGRLHARALEALAAVGADRPPGAH